MLKKILTGVLALSMVFTSANIAFAKENSIVDKNNYQSNDAYSYIVSATSGKVIKVDENGALIDTVEETDGNKLADTALFTVNKYEQVNRIQISRVDKPNNVWASNNGNLLANGTKQSNLSAGSWEGFQTEIIDEGSGLLRLKNFDGKYINKNDNKLVIGTSDSSQAESFYIISPRYNDTTVYIEHKQSGKYVKADGVNGNPITVNGDKAGDVIGDELRFSTLYGSFNEVPVMNFVSKAFKNLAWKSGGSDYVFQNTDIKAGGWESIIVVPNGDGTISFKDSENKSYITVADQKMKRGYTGELTDNEKFIIHAVTQPKKASNVRLINSTADSLTISWDGVNNSIYTGYQVIAINKGTLEQIKSEETNKTELTIKNLTAGTNYTIKVRTVNTNSPYSESESIDVQTKNGPVPAKATELTVKESDEGINLSWKEVNGASNYDVYRARSAYDKDGYIKIGEGITDTNYVDTAENEGKYNNYYKIVSKNENGESDLSDEYTSLEKALFGDNIILFSPFDDTQKIDEVIKNIFTLQNDIENNAQFNENRFSIYFKPGDYTKTKTIPVGYYTQIAGLGKTPYEVKLNNLEVPSYLPNNNATCNFWRSVENFSVIKTGDNTSYFGGWRPDQFNWSIAQAAPMRRIYSERSVSYDWNYGWASGGYVADSIIEGTSGTYSGQQFYTRNSEITGSAYGTTLNAFYQGVIAPNLPTAATGVEMLNGNGYSNWAIPTADNTQQVDTSITNTPVIKEKPFLFLDDDGEYKIFVPSLNKETKGVSWSKDSIGSGEVLSLDEFYIAKEGDNASKINKELENGKNIFFTPGVYHAEEVIKVNKADTIVLGTGMASIIPDNGETAMKVADVDGVTVAGLIFDAGEHSKSLLVVGEQGEHKDHSSNPTLLADLFFRVGGTTDKLTKADDALIINSDDVIGDHFWIWRADHGAGVAWDGNNSYHGLIVNGDDVTCYALFNEHFQDYDTLWNGENGATYFYQNEKAYDPISQEAWMSHNGKVKGYSAYKVSNKVNTHYAVGLGIYNVFIYTGPTYDSSEVQIELENAIEVPNKEGVVIENACIQTFAKADGVMQKFNHIINGTGEGVSSGIDKETGEIGEGWSRKFILSYKNGEAIRGFNGSIVEQGYQPTNEYKTDKSNLIKAVDSANEILANHEKYKPLSIKGLEDLVNRAKLIIDTEDFEQDEVDKVTTELQDGVSKASLKANKEKLTATLNNAKQLKLDIYTKASSKILVDLIEKSQVVLKDDNAEQTTVDELETNINLAISQLIIKGDKSKLNAKIAEAEVLKQEDYTSATWATLKEALTKAKDTAADEEADQKMVDEAISNLDKAIEGLIKKTVDEEPGNGGNNGNNNGGTGNNGSNNNGNQGNLPKTGGMNQSYLIALGALIMATGAIIIKRRKKEVSSK
ncbi:fibronectin type III domain-containing protein [Clostridium intestinale]|uniref:LPXTG-motif cell wall anchor domain-containing protein n=1 Tax=Clostridium intestinale DSM 6191 TaxID=1121320 RepID=A0A1M5XLM2_9CLOT|nr:fibronectin type III domain-containing protein [Clostridium intestinale]SHI00552.1 LPXTG-motif cell wall anchor domain-containing protein [Clostridium intestinale DSM 6191]